MNTLSDRLAALDAHGRMQLAREVAAEASTQELIDVLLTVDLTSWGEHHIIHALTGRGRAIFDPVASALLADPLAPGASTLGEVLVRLLDDDKIRDERVVPTLIRAVEAALDADAGTNGVANYILLLRDCSTIIGSLPELAPVARRLLDIAAIETEPHPFTHLATKWLAPDSVSAD
jgi:hypothetical protein